MRMISVVDSCTIVLNAMRYIINRCESRCCAIMTNDYAEFIHAFRSGVEMHDVFMHIQPGNAFILKVVEEVLSSPKPPRVIVILEQLHMPTLQLLFAIGVRFFLSRRDPVYRINNVMQLTIANDYISPEVLSELHKDKARFFNQSQMEIFKDVKLFTPTESMIVISLLLSESLVNLANKRFVSVKTIHSHKRNALKKLGMKKLNAFFNGVQCF